MAVYFKRRANIYILKSAPLGSVMGSCCAAQVPPPYEDKPLCAPEKVVYEPPTTWYVRKNFAKWDVATAISTMRATLCTRKPLVQAQFCTPKPPEHRRIEVSASVVDTDLAVPRNRVENLVIVSPYQFEAAWRILRYDFRVTEAEADDLIVMARAFLS
jgi:hypothetical protein